MSERPSLESQLAATQKRLEKEYKKTAETNRKNLRLQAANRELVWENKTLRSDLEISAIGRLNWAVKRLKLINELSEGYDHWLDAEEIRQAEENRLASEHKKK